MPSTIIAALCGMICSKLFLNKIFISLFRVVGAYKISFSYPRKIKKIEVYKLIRE